MNIHVYLVFSVQLVVVKVIIQVGNNFTPLLDNPSHSTTVRLCFSNHIIKCTSSLRNVYGVSKKPALEASS